MSWRAGSWKPGSIYAHSDGGFRMATELFGDMFWRSRLMHFDGITWRLGADDATYVSARALPIGLSRREFHLLMAGEAIPIAALEAIAK